MLIFSYLPVFSAENNNYDTQASVVLLPEANGMYNDWYSVGDSSNYQCVDEYSAHNGDTDYIESGTAWWQDWFEIDNHTSETGTISSVTVYAVAKYFFVGGETEPQSPSSMTIMIGNASIRGMEYVDSDVKSLTSSYVEYSYTFTTDMYGDTWTWEMIDKLQIGVNVSESPVDEVVRCTQMYAEIDYNPIDEPNWEEIHKMHYPQHPDPYGWDVNMMESDLGDDFLLADDWQCSMSGNVTEIYFWISWYNDVVVPIESFTVAIHADITADESPYGYSMPGYKLWERTFYEMEFNISDPYSGEQGWIDPIPGGDVNYELDNHYQYYLVSITNITDPFFQYNNTIYWLSLNANISSVDQEQLGWKTSLDHWNDNAVFGLSEGGEEPLSEGEFENTQEIFWWNLSDPYVGGPIDFAFVIGGEPGEEPPQDIPDYSWTENNKMHYPQLPDTDGIDYDFYDMWLGDDWECTETGTVEDISFWISWQNDLNTTIDWINVSIWSDNPSGPNGHSEPLNELWQRTFSSDEFDISLDGTGLQGFYYPDTDEYYPSNHMNYYLVNITDISQPFVQSNGTIYWLVIDMPRFDINGSYYCGWKNTNASHFNDNAVWGYVGGAPMGPMDTLLYEDFEDADSGWGTYNTLGTNAWAEQCTGESSPDFTVSCYREVEDVSGDSETWLVTPEIDATNYVSLSLSFWEKVYHGSYQDYHGVWYSTTGQDPNSNTFTELLHDTYSTESWSETIVDLSVCDHSSFYLAWRYDGDYADNWLVDEITLTGTYEEPITNDWYNLTSPATGNPVDFAFVVNGEEPTDFYVDDNYDASTPGWGTTHFATIQNAIDACTSNIDYTIHVNPGTYNENVLISGGSFNSLTVNGNLSGTRAQIYGQDTGSATVTISDSNVDFKGFYIENPASTSDYNCIRIDNTEFVNVSDCELTNTDGDLAYIVSSNDVNIYDCYIHDGDSCGITAMVSDANIYIYDNLIENVNTQGIYIYYTDAVTVYKNRIDGNLYGVRIIGSDDCLFYHNNFYNSMSGYIGAGGTNTWNLTYPGGGNYFDGHGTQDIYVGPNQDIPGSDLICDSNSPDPYVADSGNTDFYPFLNPFNGTLPPVYNYEPIVENEDPVNESTDVNIDYSNVSVDVSDVEGDLFTVYITGDYVNDQTYTDVGNGTYTASLITPLPFYTDITWNVNVSGISDFDGWTNNTYSFETSKPSFIVETPIDFDVIAVNDSQINITWITGDNATHTYIRYSDALYPTTRSEGALVCNTTDASFELTGLVPNTAYYFSAWSYNATYDKWSSSYISNTETTDRPMIVYVDDDYSAGGSGTFTFRPDADGNVTWIPNGESSNYLCVDEESSDGTSTYVQNDGTKNIELYTLDVSSTSGDIDEVTLHGYVATEDYGAGYIKFAISNDGGNSWISTGELTALSNYPTFTHKSYTWSTNPHTSSDWTWSDIENCQFGVLNDAPMMEKYLTQFYITVVYSEPVDPDFGVYHFDDIDDAVGAVAENGTIMVYDGAYMDTPYNITKPVMIRGEDTSLVTVDGTGTNGFNLQSRGIIIENISFINANNGIFGNDLNQTAILGCYFYDNTIGVYLENYSEAMISNYLNESEAPMEIISHSNIFEHNDIGVSLNDTSWIQISYNEFVNNTNNAIYEYSGNWNFIWDNYIENSSMSTSGSIYVEDTMDDDIGLNYITTQEGDGVLIENCISPDLEGVYVYSNDLINFEGTGINITNSDYVCLWYNNITGATANSYTGINLLNSNNCEIFNNRIYESSYLSGMPAWDDTGNNIWNDTIGGYFDDDCGNWWEMYNEPTEGAWDNNTDGIADDPYLIGGGNTYDYLPMMDYYGEMPIIIDAYPDSEITGLDIDLELTLDDPNGDLLNISFYWANHTLIGYDEGYTNASISLPNLEHHQSYEWYAVVNDSTWETNESFSFVTCRAFDLIPDGVVNYLDVSLMVAHYLESVSPPGSESWDINDDGETNYLDISILVANYGS